MDRAVRINIAVRATGIIVAVHAAIRVDAAVEIRSITEHEGREHIAANI